MPQDQSLIQCEFHLRNHPFARAAHLIWHLSTVSHIFSSGSGTSASSLIIAQLSAIVRKRELSEAQEWK